jgi:hypothetical protein
VSAERTGGRARRVYAPRRAAVEAGEDGKPRALAGAAVEAVREEWVVEDRWWTDAPLHRHYYELVLADGRSATVFRDVRSGRWFRQKA